LYGFIFFVCVMMPNDQNSATRDQKP
jgi:hypothetical protein